MKKILSLIIAISTLVSAFSLSVSANDTVENEGVFYSYNSYICAEDFSAQTVGASSGECGVDGSNLTWEYDYDGNLFITGSGDMADFNKGDAPWDYHSQKIENIIISDGVTSIGDKAFEYFLKLSKITLPESVKKIGDQSFYGCRNLTEITFGNVETIDFSAFEGCSALTSVKLPDTLKVIETDAFSSCVKLSQISVGKNIQYIGCDVFSNTSFYNNADNWENNLLYLDNYLIAGNSDIVTCDIADGTILIASGAFYECYNLTKVTMTDSVKYMGISVFGYCYALEDVTISKTLEVIDFNTFNNCTSLKQITIPESITRIESDAFYCCELLNNVYVPDSVYYIGSSAFGYCTSLDTVRLPKGIKTIGDNAFSSTAYHEESTNWVDYALYINEYLLEFNVPDSMIFDPTVSGGIYVPDEESTVLEKVLVRDGTVLIADSAFHACGIRSIELPDTVEIIGSFAFYHCNELEYAYIPDSVTFIGENAFMETSPNFTIKGIKGTYAEEYALKNEITFVALDEENTLPEADSDIYLDSASGTMPNIIEKTNSSHIVSSLEKHGIHAVMTDKNGNALEENSLVGTGCKAVLSDGKQYTVIVAGDVDGNGEITATDYLQIKNAFYSKLNLENEYFSAADIDKNNEITSTDYLRIKSYFLGVNDLYS